MNRRVWQVVLTLACLVAASALLPSCASRTASLAPPAGDGAGGSGSAGADTPAGLMARAGALFAPDRLAAGGGLAGGGWMPAGATIPALPAPDGFAEISALRDVRFDFDQYRIRPEDARTLEANARWLQAHAGALVLIEGHADERGTNEYNLALGERRAAAARDYLVALGVSRGRITLVSYGEERPLCVERTEPCWAENRRAHFLVKP